MKINFEITKDDYIKFNLYHLENSKLHKNIFNIIRYIIPITLCIPIYLIGTRVFNQPSIYWIIVAMGFLIIWILTYPKEYRKSITKRVDKFISQGDNSSIFGSKTLEIIDGAIVVKGDFISETISLEGIKDIRIYEDMILIYLSGFVAQIIPRRYLDKETEKEFIKELKSIKSLG